MSIIGSNILAGASGQATGYNLNNSLRFRSSASGYLDRTPAGAGNRKTWTWSSWIKRGQLSTVQVLFGVGNVNTGTSFGGMYFTSTDTLIFYSPTTGGYKETTQVFRDPSAWYHLVVSYDTPNSVVKLYVNGTEITAFSTNTNPSANVDGNVNAAVLHNIGKNASTSQYYFDGYLAEVNFIDGTALTPSSFGETSTTTGSWIPKKYTSTYGTNGFYLKFADASAATAAAIGKDSSGNGNNWTPSGISVTAGTTYDAMLDVPTNTSATVANYATLNPLIPSTLTYSEANLTVQRTTSNWEATGSTISVSQGKWYAEFVWTAGTYAIIGVEDMDLVSIWDNEYIGYSVNGRGYGWDGNVRNNASDSAYGSTFTTGDIIGVAIDMDNKFVYMSKNNVFQNSGVPTSGATGTGGLSLAGTNYIIGAAAYNATISANFGQRPFSYTAPSGYVALNTYNLPDSTIKKGNSYMNAVLYTGNGSTNAITGVGFSPDFVWVKNRAAGEHHCLYDSVRGIYKQLYSNLTNTEDNATNSLLSFDSDGFTLGNSTTPNTNGNAHVAWNWRGSDSTAVSNTSGSITSTVSASTTAGFSVVTYTGTGANATVGHGLGVAPSIIICKPRSAVDGWMSYHSALGNTKYIMLNTTAAAAVGSGAWNNTSPTSSVFSIGTSGNVNTNGVTMVAYCWADVSGFSKAFSYTGNGSADGSFVYVGFLPRFVMIKRTDTTGDWYMWDTARNTYDVITNTLLANSSAAETSATSIDALSNGFKLRNTTAGFNASGGTYIGMAWATSPFKNSNAF